MLANPGLDGTANWQLGPGWTVSGGAAAHAVGSAGALRQALPLVSGAWYRLAWSAAALSAGSIQPALAGSADRPGTARTASGRWTDRLQASGTTAVEWRATAAADGLVDNVVLYPETATCLAQGTHYIWLEPLNADGLPGPVAGPITVIVE